MKAVGIAGTSVRRMLRDRSNIFFVFIFPMLLILLIGLAFGGGTGQRVAVSSEAPAGGYGDRIVAALEAAPALEVVRYEDEAGVEEAVSRGWVSAGVVVPRDVDDVAADGGESSLRLLTRPDGSGALVAALVDDALVRERAVLHAAGFVAGEGLEAFGAALGRATAIAPQLPGIGVSSRAIGEGGLASELAAAGRFDLGASQQLLLFVFLVTLAGSAALIQSRQLGVTRRMLATPTSVTTILLGETLGRFFTAMVQGVYIVVGTAVVFDVSWGDPVAALALLTVFAFVSAGAAMLLGSALDNDAQAGGLGVLLGLGLAALGGCMVYLEFFSPGMRRVAFLTPHAWALDGYGELILRGGGLLDVAPQLAVLVAYAAALTAAGVWLLRRSLLRA